MKPSTLPWVPNWVVAAAAAIVPVLYSTSAHATAYDCKDLAFTSITDDSINMSGKQGWHELRTSGWTSSWWEYAEQDADDDCDTYAVFRIYDAKGFRFVPYWWINENEAPETPNGPVDYCGHSAIDFLVWGKKNGTWYLMVDNDQGRIAHEEWYGGSQGSQSYDCEYDPAHFPTSNPGNRYMDFYQSYVEPYDEIVVIQKNWSHNAHVGNASSTACQESVCYHPARAWLYIW